MKNNIEIDIQEEKRTLKDIPPIEESNNSNIPEKEKLKDFVEEPLIDTVTELMEKGVETIASSANKKDLLPTKGFANITLNWESLSDENKEILGKKDYAEMVEFGNFKKDQAVDLKIPVNDLMTIDEIKEIAKNFVKDLKPQPANWIKEYTLKELMDIYSISIQEYTENPDCFEDTGFFYDPNSQKFYLGKWLYEIKNKQQKP